jgi:hypothetical protein
VYVKGHVHTNTVEGFLSLLKRGINGTFHHIGKGHLAKYCDEFSFRYTHREISDSDRAELLVEGAEGKRLPTSSQQERARIDRERFLGRRWRSGSRRHHNGSGGQGRRTPHRAGSRNRQWHHAPPTYKGRSQQRPLPFDPEDV